MRLVEFCEGTWPPTFETGWHHRMIAHYLEQVMRGKVKNLMVNTPPQHSKTTIVGERFPVYVLGHDSRLHFLLTSYSDDIARRSARTSRDLVLHPFVQENFPLQLGTATDTRWTLKAHDSDGRYSMVAAGLGGSITGHPADYAVTDDSLRGQTDAASETIRQNIWDNYTGSVETRLSKNGHQVMIGTRWHQDDLPGRLLKRALENAKAAQWTVLVLSATNDSGEDAYVWDTGTGEKKFLPPYEALWPQMFPRSVLDERRLNIGESKWSALYMQRPVPGGGLMFRPEAWGTLDWADAFRLLQAWDCASKVTASNDYTACVTLAQTQRGSWQVLDVWRSRLEYPQLKQAVFARWVTAHQQYGLIPEAVVIEDANAGTQLIQEIEYARPHLINVVPIKPTRSKVGRAEGVSSYVANGMVALPKEARWRDSFVKECEEFPLGEHDDQVDAFVHGLAYFTRSRDFAQQSMTVPIVYDALQAHAEQSDEGPEWTNWRALW